MIVGPITIRSACSHHLCPIMGRVDRRDAQPAFQPDWPVKYARLADWVMSRPQIQEEAVSQLANLLQEKFSQTALPW